jgi:hypothetical protein
MIKRTQLTVALDMLIDYLLQEAPMNYNASIDRSDVGQASGTHEVGPYATTELMANIGCSVFATEG